MTRVLAMALALTACASAKDVGTRGRALEARLDPETHGFCSPQARALGLAEVAFARGASQRGDALAAERHLDRADELAAAVAADATCAAPDVPKDTPGPVFLQPKDLDEDGVPDQVDPDDDNDGASDIVDQCPRDAEDVDGVEDIDGCPEPE